MTLYAHFGGGHWYEWPIYFAPFLLILVFVLVEGRRAKRAQASKDVNDDGKDNDD